MTPEDVIKIWNESAVYWEKHRDTVHLMFDPVTRALIDAARIKAGQAVLDVATGPGEPALSIAAVVGKSGSVCGVDPIAAMIEAARREVQRRALTNVRFEIAPADKLSFSDGTFDAAVSRFGVMFFPDPPAGVREMLRAVKPGGRVALAVWYHGEKNPYYHVPMEALSRYIDSPPAHPDAPGALRFAERGKLLRILKEAGAVDAEEHVLRFEISARISPDKFWQVRTELSDAFRTKIAKLSAEQLAEVKRDVLQAMQVFFSADAMSIPAEVLIVSGSKQT